MKISCGSDHAGRELLLVIIDWLSQAAHQYVVHGAQNNEQPVDYPKVAVQVCADIATHQAEFGILVCGSGIGMSMAANRCGQRAAACFHEYTAKVSRSHNDAKVLCLGSRIIAPCLAIEIVETFLATTFSGERHIARIAQLENL
jgi:ribose 5-phosphate isomerase B